MFIISDSAAKRIKKVISEEEPDMLLRVSVQGGGCTGFKYSFNLEFGPEEDDFQFEKDGIKILIDPVSMQYLNEAEIDYVESLMGSNFTIKNPNVTTTCGCGASFAV